MILNIALIVPYILYVSYQLYVSGRVYAWILAAMFIAYGLSTIVLGSGAWWGILAITVVVGLSVARMEIWRSEAPESLMITALMAMARPGRIRKAWDKHKEQLLAHGWWMGMPKHGYDFEGSIKVTEEMVRDSIRRNGGVVKINGVLDFHVLEVVGGLREIVLIGILPDLPPKRRRVRKKSKLKVPSWGRAPSESYGHVTS